MHCSSGKVYLQVTLTLFQRAGKWRDVVWHAGSGGQDAGELCEVRFSALCQHGGGAPQALNEMAQASLSAPAFA